MLHADHPAVGMDVERPEGRVSQGFLQRLDVHAAKTIRPRAAGKEAADPAAAARRAVGFVPGRRGK